MISEILNILFKALDVIKNFFNKKRKKNIFYKRTHFIVSDEFENMSSIDLFEHRDELIKFIESFIESEYFAVKLKNLMPGFVGFIDSKFIVKETRRLRKDIRENKKEIIKTIEEFIDLRNK